MKEALIVTNATYAAKTGGGTIAGAHELTSLATGAVAAFDEDGSLISSSAPAIAGDRIYMAVGMSTGSPWLTSLINRETFEYTAALYAAPVAKEIVIGEEVGGGTTGVLNFPSPLVVGSTATIIVYDASLPYEKIVPQSRIYSYVVKTGDDADDIMDGLEALILADTKAIVTPEAVTAGDGGINLVGAAGHNFTVELGGILVNAEMETKTEVTLGQGTYTQVKELVEKDSWVRRGYANTDNRGHDLWSVVSNAAAADTFNIITCNWRNSSPEGLQLHQPSYKKELMIAVKDATLYGAIGTIFAAV